MAVPLHKRARRWVRGLLLRGMIAVLSLLPRRLALGLGRWLGALGWRLARGERRRAEKHLRRAFPEASPEEVSRISRQCFVGLGEHLMENVCVGRIDDRLLEHVRLPPQSRDVLDAALGVGRGVVVVTGHIGNWELAARAIARAGYEVVAIAKRSHDPNLGRLIERFRESGGVETLYRGDAGTAKRMLRQFKSGSALFMLVDQDTDVPSLFVPFFGRTAKTPRAPADLVLRSNGALVAGFIHRDAPGRGHEIRLERIAYETTGDREADAQALTARINRVLEDELRAHPADWVWFHRRWRSRPDA